MENENLYLTPEYLDIMVEQSLLTQQSADGLIIYMKAIAKQSSLINKENEKHDDGLGFKNHLGIPYVIDQYLAYAEKEGLMPKITSVNSIIGLFGEINKED